MKARFALIFFFFIVLSSSVASQENQKSYWINKGLEMNCKETNSSASDCYQAEIYFDKAIQMDPLCSDEASEGNQLCAKAWCEKGFAVSNNPDNYPEDQNKPINKSAYYVAINCFDKALQLNPSYAKALIGKSEALSILGAAETQESKIKDAITCSNMAIEIEPENSDAWNSKGMAYYASKDIENRRKALDYFMQALDYDKCNTEARENIAIVLDEVSLPSNSELQTYMQIPDSCLKRDSRLEAG